MRPFLLALLLLPGLAPAQTVIIPPGSPSFTTGGWNAPKTCPAHQVMIRSTINGGVCIQLSSTDILGGGVGGGGTWGSIIGTLANQTDLAVALALKAGLVAPIFTSQVTIPDITLAQHTHVSGAGGGTLDAAAIASGLFAIGRMPTGTSGTTVALGNHLHTGVYAPVTHAASHQNGGADEIATATPAANVIPKAGAGGKLAIGFLATGIPDGTKFVSDAGTLITPSISGAIPRTVYLSQIAGIHMDGSLTASTGTDDKAAINTVLATATASSPLLLILDGVSAIDSSGTGLVVKSYTTIKGLGRNTGFCSLGGTNTNQKPVITNANPVGTGASTDQDLAFETFTINGNWATGHGATGGRGLGYSGSLFLSNIRIVGATRVRMVGLKSYQAVGYGIHLANVTDAFVQDIRIENALNVYATDGVHVNGPASNIIIDHVSGFSGDDMVSLTTEDCHLAGGSCDAAYGDNSLATSVKVGAITKVTVSNVFVEAGEAAFRLLSANSLMDDVAIRNVSGTVYGELAWMDRFAVDFPGSAGNFGTITVENLDVVPTATPFGQLITLDAKFRQLNVTLACKDHTVAQPVFLSTSATNIYNFNLRAHCSNSAGLPAPFFKMSGGTILNFHLSGEYDPNGGSTQSTNPIVSLTGGTIANLVIDDFTADHINNIVNNAGGTITSLMLAGGRHTSAGGNATVANPAGTITNFSAGAFVSTLLTSGTIGTNVPGVALLSMGSPQMAVVNTRRTCQMLIRTGSTLVNGDLAEPRWCFIPAAATVVEVLVTADAGTSNTIVARNRAGVVTNLLSGGGTLATASSGGLACSNTGGTTGVDGATACGGTLTTTSLAAGDWLDLVSGTSTGSPNKFTVVVTYTVN